MELRGHKIVSVTSNKFGNSLCLKWSGALNYVWSTVKNLFYLGLKNPLFSTGCPVENYCMNGGSCLYYSDIGELACQWVILLFFGTKVADIKESIRVKWKGV